MITVTIVYFYVVTVVLDNSIIIVIFLKLNEFVIICLSFAKENDFVDKTFNMFTQQNVQG